MHHVEPYTYLNYDIDFSDKWCYLSDLLKLERENNRLKKENEELKSINQTLIIERTLNK